VYPASFDYVRPAVLAEALELLASRGPEAKLLAGGASLIPLMKLRLATPAVVIDIGNLSELVGESVRDGRTVIGAVTRHAAIEDSKSLLAMFPLLHDLASQIGDPQVRNMGTIGGSIAEADPAGDWATGLLALDASVTCASARGRRTLPARDLFVDAYTTALEPDEMVIEVVLPEAPRPRSGGAHLKLERRTGDFAVANCSVQLTLGADGSYQSVHAAVGGVALTPFRATESERILTGKRPSEELLREAADAVTEGQESFSDLRGSAEYRKHVAGVMFVRAVGVARRRAGGEKVGLQHG
jgi:carbon-monoxide dehydrogenase medium subunit